ncbi:glycosyltransferase [Paractinoplanes lichenicola]|uniref:glycosyltransferase n=1 Tax=Paractinoplanes lichenicola TaxID=2802976 RepID=UPI0027DB7ED8|nr:glycosyltransferase [Actinoplanes lichenicola]
MTAAGSRLRLALTATAARNRSLDARELMTRAALGEHGTLDQLLQAARTGDRRWLRRIRRRVDPGLVAAIAQILGLQELLPTDRDDAIALFELVRRACGARALSPANQTLHVQLALAHQGPERARKLLRRYLKIGESARAGLTADLLVGRRGWADAFQALMPVPGPTGALFDELSTAPVERVEGSHRVSVIVTAYRPDRGLITAVRSILAQSWANTEVIIVDDASPPEFEPVLREAVALGDRITLITMPENSGTYAARNAGLDAAGGEFATFQDSDDWSHPRRIELQVRPLIEDRRLVATTSDGLAVTDELMCTRPGVRSGRFNPSSLLLRRGTVLRTVGYFDRLRKAADSEYIGRIQAAFGAGRVRHLDSLPLALIRLSAGSLSRAEIRAHWMHPARTSYMSAYQRHHQLIAQRRASAYRPADGSDRAFPAPDHLLGTVRDRAYDVVMVADWRFLESTQRTALDELRALHSAGLRVAVLQLDSYRAIQLRRLPLATPVQDLVNDGIADRIALADSVTAALLVVRQAGVLQFAGATDSGVRAERALIVADRAPVRADGSDHRYDPAVCSAVARGLFGAEPSWVPQDPGVRAALRTVEKLEPDDLPLVLAPGGWVADRTGASVGSAIVGTDLCDAANWPPDAADSLAVCRRVPQADVRVRLPDRPAGTCDVPVEPTWLGYQTGDLEPRPFLHQLDFYLHFPPREQAEWYSRPALEAAAAGCVVVMPARYRGLYGDAAVYCTRSEVDALVARYRADPALFAEQSRRARQTVAAEYDPGRLVAFLAGDTSVSLLTIP